MSLSGKTTYFKGVNFLRFISALAIIVYHSTLNWQSGIDNFLKLGAHNLVIGVDIFFIISGFLITYLLIFEKSNYPNISLKKFYIRRFLRIFPVYYLVIFISYLIFNKSHPETDYLSNLLFIGNFSMISTNLWTVAPMNPLWSICIEEHFYLIIPLIVYLIPTSKLKLVLFSIILISIIFRGWATANIVYNWKTIYLHTLSRCDVIAIGGLIAIWYHSKKHLFKLNNIYLFFSSLILILLLLTVDVGDYSTVLKATLKKYIFIIPICIMFITFILPSQEQSQLARRLKENKTLDYLGKISYGLYMYHSFVILYLDRYINLNNSLIIKITIVTLLTIAISIISYEFFEKKILKFKKNYEV